MTVVYGWKLWVCETCGRSEMYRAGVDYSSDDDYPYAADFWDEHICNDCYSKAHPRREIEGDYEVTDGD